MIVLIASIGVWSALMLAAVAVNDWSKSTRAKSIARSVMAGLVGLGAYYRGEPTRRQRAEIRRTRIRNEIKQRSR